VSTGGGAGAERDDRSRAERDDRSGAERDDRSRAERDDRPGAGGPGPRAPQRVERAERAAGPATGRSAEPARQIGFGPDFLTELFRFPLDPGYADAAARRVTHGPRTGRRRAALRAASAVTALVIGLLLVVAYRQTLSDEPGRSRARAGLVAQVKERQEATDDLQRRADRLRDEVARQRDLALNDTEVARLRNMEAATGLARVRGDGVVVTVDDAPSAVDAVTGAGKEQDLGRVFDRDLQYIANALWAAGAEAVAINGQRLTATTTIRSAGRAILVDFRPVTGPYEVAAIGPDDLAGDFSASPAAHLLRSLVSTYGMSYDIREVDDLTLPGAAEPRLRFARPATTPTPGSSGSPVPSNTPSGDRSAGVPEATASSTDPPGGGP
jgi:uncharacterized protein YlxW (UPF0749 family)